MQEAIGHDQGADCGSHAAVTSSDSSAYRGLKVIAGRLSFMVTS
jgi:hypothetical protein